MSTRRRRHSRSAMPLPFSSYLAVPGVVGGAGAVGRLDQKLGIRSFMYTIPALIAEEPFVALPTTFGG
jgi:hypothetical protein